MCPGEKSEPHGEKSPIPAKVHFFKSTFFYCKLTQLGSKTKVAQQKCMSTLDTFQFQREENNICSSLEQQTF